MFSTILALENLYTSKTLYLINYNCNTFKLLAHCFYFLFSGDHISDFVTGISSGKQRKSLFHRLIKRTRKGKHLAARPVLAWFTRNRFKPLRINTRVRWSSQDTHDFNVEECLVVAGSWENSYRHKMEKSETKNFKLIYRRNSATKDSENLMLKWSLIIYHSNDNEITLQKLTAKSDW